MRNISQYLNEVPQYITKRQLCNILAVSPSTVDRRQNENDPGYDPSFPKKHYFGVHSTRYDLADVLRYLKENKLNVHKSVQNRL